VISGVFSSSAVSGETYILLSLVIVFGSGKIKKTMKKNPLIAVIKIMYTVYETLPSISPARRFPKTCDDM
jgi:hypothetical protein